LSSKQKAPALARRSPSRENLDRTLEVVHAETPSGKTFISRGNARPAPPDDAGESDYAFFTKRPHIDSRVRFPFENEYSSYVLAPGRSAFVRIQITRDSAGQPKRARRVLRFCKAGRS
jgi:hypothetical protein